MADPKSFPVRVTKGSGDDKITRTAHSIIAFRQLATQGFVEEGKRKPRTRKPAQNTVKDETSVESEESQGDGEDVTLPDFI